MLALSGCLPQGGSFGYHRTEWAKSLSMNRLLFKSGWPLMGLVTLFTGVLVSQAGDAIIFSSGNPKAEPLKSEPGREIPKSRENLSVWDSLPTVDPRSIEGLTRPSQRNSRRKTKEEQQRQMEQDQKRNWLLLRPDQLREEQEQKESVPFPDRDARTEEGNEKRDYTFHGLGERKDGREGKRPDLGRGRTEDADAGGGRNISLQSKSGQDVGAHAAKELDLKDLLRPGQDLRADDVDKSDRIWRDLTGSGGATRTREQSLDRLDRLGSSLVTGSKGPSEWGRAPSTPTFTKPLDVPSRSGGGSAFGGLPASRNPLAPGASDWTAQRSTTPSQSASSAPRYNPWDQQPVNRPSIVRPTVLEIPQRKL